MAPNFKIIEWAANGANLSYGKMTQRSYVVEIYLTDDVQGDILQAAVDKALERLPYYRWAIVRKKGLYHYAENDLPFLVAEHKGPRPLGGEATNYHMIDVTYSGKQLDFAMFHGFCDGLGLNRFIEATLYHYMCLKDGQQYDSTGIITDAIPYDEAELYDPYLEKVKADTKELKELASYEGRFHLPELDQPTDDGPTMYRLPLRIKTEDLIAWCKANSTSPAAAISAIMAKGIVSQHDVTEGTVMSVLPASLRKYLGADKTFKNCSVAFFIPMKAEDVNRLSTGELAALARATMKTQMNERMANLLYTGIDMVIHLGKKMPTFGLKTKVLAMGENKPQDTYLVDYVGGLTANGYGDQITEVRYLNPTASRSSNIILLSSTAGYFHINFTQTYESDRYYQAFCAVLDEQGIPYEKLPFDTYLNPAVELPAEQK